MNYIAIYTLYINISSKRSSSDLLVPEELRDAGHHVAVVLAGQERPKVQRMARDLLLKGFEHPLGLHGHELQSSLLPKRASLSLEGMEHHWKS